MTVTLTNNQIYNYASALVENFSNQEMKFPIKVNFYLQKNQTELLTLAQDIEKQRVEIIQKYGTLNKETQQYDIPTEEIQNATKEIADLFELTQDVKIYKVDIDAFGDIELTSSQMQALLFMIKDED